MDVLEFRPSSEANGKRIGEASHPGPVTNSEKRKLSGYFTAAHNGRNAVTENMIKVLMLAKNKVLNNNDEKFDEVMSDLDKAAAQNFTYKNQLISKDGYKKLMAFWRKIYGSERGGATSKEELFIKLLVECLISNNSANNRILFRDLSDIVSDINFALKNV
eukprot:g5725.t1